MTHDITVGNTVLSATIGFNESDQPAEVFLSGAKDGSTMAAILADASVVISIALQHGLAAALAKSISRARDATGRISASVMVLRLICSSHTTHGHVRCNTYVATEGNEDAVRAVLGDRSRFPLLPISARGRFEKEESGARHRARRSGV